MPGQPFALRKKERGSGGPGFRGLRSKSYSEPKLLIRRFAVYSL